MLFTDIPTPAGRAAVRDLAFAPFWLDDPTAPSTLPALNADIATDLLIVGAGFTGLWTALIAKERNPDRDVVLVDADRLAGDGEPGRRRGLLVVGLVLTGHAGIILVSSPPLIPRDGG